MKLKGLHEVQDNLLLSALIEKNDLIIIKFLDTVNKLGNTNRKSEET